MQESTFPFAHGVSRRIGDLRTTGPNSLVKVVDKNGNLEGYQNHWGDWVDPVTEKLLFAAQSEEPRRKFLIGKGR